MSIAPRFVSLVAAIAAAGLAVAAQPASADGPNQRLGALIQRHLRSGGPFFTGEERAVIERACGYARGQWDGFEIRHHDNVLVCANGRRVDDPEVRRVVRSAAPRIARRVSAVMARDDVRAEISRISEEATGRAMRALAARDD